MALEIGTQSWTFSALCDAVARRAAALVDAGVSPGDRVAVEATPTFTAVRDMQAVLWAGAALLPLSTKAGEAERQRLLEGVDHRVGAAVPSPNCDPLPPPVLESAATAL
jgi:malonyl-CoA/methylmalonyl-CoA synthetase